MSGAKTGLWAYINFYIARWSTDQLAEVVAAVFLFLLNHPFGNQAFEDETGGLALNVRVTRDID